ncbi:hypothetical protein J6590_039384 [Homalodisca vitripennis]|nr:hypothetical protein J6590_039384 [Homalodisca vitripennis]
MSHSLFLFPSFSLISALERIVEKACPPPHPLYQPPIVVVLSVLMECPDFDEYVLYFPLPSSFRELMYTLPLPPTLETITGSGSDPPPAVSSPSVLSSQSPARSKHYTTV